MARIAGITLPPDKRIEIGLTYIFGIGRSKANAILQAAKIDKDKKVKALSEDEVNKIRKIIETQEKIEEDQIRQGPAGEKEIGRRKACGKGKGPRHTAAFQYGS